MQGYKVYNIDMENITMQLIGTQTGDNATVTFNFFNDLTGEGARCCVAHVGGAIWNAEIEIFNTDLGLRKFIHSNSPEPSAEYIQSLCEKHFVQA